MARRTTGHPILPAGIFADILEQFGEDTADMALDNVQDGTWSVEDVENFMNRDDVDPDDWQKFEEGWRPAKW